MQAILNFISRLIELFTKKKTIEIPQNNPPIDAPPRVPDVYRPDGLLTREQYESLNQAIFDGRIKLSPYSDTHPYKLLRETNGNNRSKGIDALILRQGGSLGQPYCQYGQQDKMDALALYLKIPRKYWNYPEGGGTQRVLSLVDDKYKRTLKDEPLSCCFVTVEYNNSGKGHIEDIYEVVEKLENPIGFKVKTRAFNTTIDGDDSIVRDGAGAGLATRKIFQNWIQVKDKVELKGFVDHYLIYVDAYNKFHGAK